MVRAFSSWPNVTLIDTKVKRARRSIKSRNWLEDEVEEEVSTNNDNVMRTPQDVKNLDKIEDQAA